MKERMKQYGKSVFFRISEEDLGALQKIANEEARTVASVIRQAIRNFIKNKKGGKK